MTISRLRTPILLVGAFVLAFGAALWALAATGGTDSVRAATDDAEVSEEDRGAHGKEGCSERKEQMLDKLVENETITEDQKATVLSLMEQVKDGDITHEEFKAALEEEGVDLPKPKFRGHKGGPGGHMGKLDPEAMAEKKAEMLDKLVENGTITEDQKATIQDLTEQLMSGDLTKEEFKAALEDAEIDIPRPGKGGFRGHHGGGPGAPSADETAVTTAL